VRNKHTVQRVNRKYLIYFFLVSYSWKRITRNEEGRKEGKKERKKERKKYAVTTTKMVTAE
jgi:hypothetical protein